MIKQEDVTIIIPHLGKTEEQKYALHQTLGSLQATVPDMKKIIAINGIKFEEDFTLGKKGLEGYDLSNISLMTIEEQGQCKAVNAAIASTNTPWIFVTNDDMVFPLGWWEHLVEGEYEGHELCVSPKLIEPRPGAPTFEVYPCGGAGGDFDKQKWLDFAFDYYVEHPAVETRPGFNLPFLMRRDLWETIGGYDISYDPWGSNSDSDLEYKIKLAGVQPVQRASCIVYHFSQTSGTFEPQNQPYWHKNWEYFIQKWGFPRTDAGIWEATFEIPNEGRIFRPEWEGKYAVHN